MKICLKERPWNLSLAKFLLLVFLSLAESHDILTVWIELIYNEISCHANKSQLVGVYSVKYYTTPPGDISNLASLKFNQNIASWVPESWCRWPSSGLTPGGPGGPFLPTEPAATSWRTGTSDCLKADTRTQVRTLGWCVWHQLMIKIKIMAQ